MIETYTVFFGTQHRDSNKMEQRIMWMKETQNVVSTVWSKTQTKENNENPIKWNPLKQKMLKLVLLVVLQGDRLM